MADIEVIIKVPEEDWKLHRWSKAVFDGVINGTPLPKGHGKIGDFGCILKRIFI